MLTSNSSKKSSSTRLSRKASILGLTFAALLTQGFISCSSDDGDTGTAPGPGVSTGIFLDCEVEGLTYQSGNNPPAQTDENGVFTYTSGETLSFSVGGVQLGTLTDGAPVCTPFDFVIPENIARFLQSLDADGDPSNGIDLRAASDALAGTNVTSNVFENPSSTGFAADPAITGALAVTGDTLLDTATTNTNLRNGTDTTFDVAELAGFAFVLSDPLDAGLGVVKFNDLVNPGDQGSSGSSTPFDETVAQGGLGIGEDFIWVINSNGGLDLTFEDGSTTSIKKSGSSSRAITGVETEPGAAPVVLTLLKALPVTETDMSGAPITVSGTSTKPFTITDPNGTETIVFKADGTLTASGSASGPWSGFWTVGEVAPNVIKVIDGTSPDQVPGDWSLVVFLDGSPSLGGQLFVADVTFNGLEAGTDNPNFTWEEFLFLAISPN